MANNNNLKTFLEDFRPVVEDNIKLANKKIKKRELKGKVLPPFILFIILIFLILQPKHYQLTFPEGTSLEDVIVLDKSKISDEMLDLYYINLSEVNKDKYNYILITSLDPDNNTETLDLYESKANSDIFARFFSLLLISSMLVFLWILLILFGSYTSFEDKIIIKLYDILMNIRLLGDGEITKRHAFGDNIKSLSDITRRIYKYSRNLKDIDPMIIGTAQRSLEDTSRILEDGVSKLFKDDKVDVQSEKFKQTEEYLRVLLSFFGEYREARKTSKGDSHSLMKRLDDINGMGAETYGIDLKKAPMEKSAMEELRSVSRLHINKFLVIISAITIVLVLLNMFFKVLPFLLGKEMPILVGIGILIGIINDWFKPLIKK